MMQKFSLPATSDGLQLAGIEVIPDSGEPKGIVQLLHGMCDHKERYFPFMRFLASQGFVCVIHDHRGHGASVRDSSDLGFMYRGGWRAMVDDARAVNAWAHDRHPHLPLALFGHSMGSMVARSYAKRYDDTIDALIVCGCPSYSSAAPVGRVLARAIASLRGGHYRPGLLHRLSFGSFNRPFRHEGFPQAWVCSDLSVLEAYHSDPLCMFNFTANGYANLFGLMIDCYSPKGWRLANPDLPVMFVSGADDPCRISDLAFAVAVDCMRRVGYRRVASKLYPNMRHEILNETQKKQVWDDLASGLKSLTSSR